MTPPRIATVGDTLAGRYEVTDVLAQGGQGMLFLATDQTTRSEVACKQLTADPSSAEFSRELARTKRAAAIRIGHPSVLDPFDYFEDDGHFTIFPYVRGVDLSQWTSRNGLPVEPAGAVTLVSAVAEGLAAIHDAGLVHRDIKPGNLMIPDAGGVRILDFGIARSTRDCTISAAGTVVGTPAYMAPEQFEHCDVDGRADIYSLGLILYELLTGRHPRSGRTAVTLRAQANGTEPPPPSQIRGAIPAHLDRVCTRLLTRRLEHRYRDARELLGDLAASGGVTPTVQRCLACGARLKRTDTCNACGRVLGDLALEFVAGPAAGQLFVIPQGTYELGRSQLCPGDNEISRRQLIVGCGSGVCIRDADAVNPTLLDGQRPGGTVPLGEHSRLSIARNEAVVRRRP